MPWLGSDPSPRAALARRPRGAAGPARAPRARQLLPRPPGVVHRPRRRRRAGESRRSRAAQRAAGRRPQRAGRPLHADHARRRPRSLRGRRQRCRAPTPPTSTRRGWATSPHPAVAAVTITVTEAGYLRGADGGLDADRPEVGRTSRPCGATRPRSSRTDAGAAAGRARRAPAGRRRTARVVPCDNVAGNGAIVARVVATLPSSLVPGVLDWLDESVSFVTTMVDRITPRTAPDDVRAVLAGTGRDDRVPVVTEPFKEWVLAARSARAGRPGRTPAPRSPTTSRRSSTASCGCSTAPIRCSPTPARSAATTTVAEAAADDACRGWVEQWWSEASPHLAQPAEESRPIAPRCSSASRTRACTTASPGSRWTARRSCRSGSCPCCAPSAPRAGCPRAPHARWPRGCAICAASARPSMTRAPTKSSRSRGGPSRTRCRALLEQLAPGLGADDETVALVVDQSRQSGAGG